MYGYDGNYQAADAYHNRLAEAEAAWEEALREFPPTCTVCKLANLTPDGTWCLCGSCDEWRGGSLECPDPDLFEPTDQWEGAEVRVLWL